MLSTTIRDTTAAAPPHIERLQAGGQLVQHQPAMLPTLLGQARGRIHVAGRIRPGIKVLTRQAAEYEQARAIYDRGVAAGEGFDAIERQLLAALPKLKNPLTPKNVPYFTVRACDFPSPEIASQIMEAFGEDRGDGVQRLYRFPVVFPADAWQNVMPHELAAWTASERRFWSEYSPDGQQRHCMTYASVPVSGQGSRPIRIWGGRKAVPREDNGGLCDPETCPQYQLRQCNLSGRFIFFVPGIKSSSAFDLPTNSFYAMHGAIQLFQTIGFMRGGRISGFLDRHRSTFYITKRLVEVSRLKDGVPTKVSQWLIEVEAPVDVTALLTAEAPAQALARAEQALAVLQGFGDAAARTATEPEAGNDEGTDETGHESEGQQDALPPSASAPADAAAVPVVSQATPAVDADMPRDSAPAGPARPASTPSTGRTQAPRARQHGPGEAPADSGLTVAQVLEAATAAGVTADRFERYAQVRWGTGWKLNPNGRKRVRDAITACGGDGKTLAAMVAEAIGHSG